MIRFTAGLIVGALCATWLIGIALSATPAPSKEGDPSHA